MFLLGICLRESCTDDLNESNHLGDLFTITGVNVDMVRLCQKQPSVYAAVK